MLRYCEYCAGGGSRSRRFAVRAVRLGGQRLGVELGLGPGLRRNLQQLHQPHTSLGADRPWRLVRKLGADVAVFLPCGNLPGVSGSERWWPLRKDPMTISLRLLDARSSPGGMRMSTGAAPCARERGDTVVPTARPPGFPCRWGTTVPCGSRRHSTARSLSAGGAPRPRTRRRWDRGACSCVPVDLGHCGDLIAGTIMRGAKSGDTIGDSCFGARLFLRKIRARWSRRVLHLTPYLAWRPAQRAAWSAPGATP